MRIASLIATMALLLSMAQVSAEEIRTVLPHLKNGRIVEEPGFAHVIFDVGAPVLGHHLRAFLDAEL